MLWNAPFGIEIIFKNPSAFWFLFLVPFFWVLACFWFWARGKALRDPWIKMHLDGSFLPGVFRVITRSLIASLALTLIILVLAKPEKKVISNMPEYGGIRITFLFDSSLSMKRAEDLKPNRLVAAKKIIADFIKLSLRDPELKGRYKFSVIPFAGGAIPFFMPFTASAGEFLSALEEVDERTVAVPGTSLYAALAAYEELLFRYPAPDAETVDVAVLISDGGKEEQKAEEVNLVRRIMDILGKGKNKVIVNTVGVGKVLIKGNNERVSEPVELIIRDDAGNFIDFYREKPNESPYKSRLDEKILMDVASLGRGRYYHFSSEKEMAANFKETVLKHRKFKGNIAVSGFEPARTWFLFPAFALFYFVFGYHEWIFRMRRRTHKNLN